MAGFADTITFGGSTKAREAIYGDWATQNHQGAAFVGGQVTGIGVSFALGYGSAGQTANLARGAWAIRAAQAYTAVGSAHGVANSSYHLAKGDFALHDTLGFIPLAGFGIRRFGRFINPRARRLAEYQSYRAAGATSREARYLMQPYSSGSRPKYHHWLPRRIGYDRLNLPERLMENRFNLMGRAIFGRGSNISRGQFYRRHAMADSYFSYAHLKLSQGMRGWNAVDYGITTAPRPLRWWYGMPDATRLTAVLGSTAALSGGSSILGYFHRVAEEK